MPKLGCRGASEMGEEDQMYLPSRYKVSREDIMYSMVPTVNNAIIHLDVAKRIDLKSSHHKKNNLTMMVTDVNETLW